MNKFYFFGVAKAGLGSKGFLLMDFMSEAQQFNEQILLLYVQKVYCYACKWIWVCVRRTKCTGHTKKSDSPNLIPFYSSAFSAKSLQLKCCCKSEARKRLSFVCNNNKAFRTKNKKWQSVDAWMKCTTPKTDESMNKSLSKKTHAKTR